MKFRIRYIIFLCVFICSFSSALHGQGLGFRGNDYPIDERTSYDVFSTNTPEFSGKLNISFDISIVEPSRLGYIVRIKNKETKTTYNLSYYNNGNSILFKFNEEGRNTLITADFNASDIPLLHWFGISISFDLNNNSLHLTINDKEFTADGLKLTSRYRPDIYFGKSDHMIDVPSFSIRQLAVSDKKQVYEFPLKENTGKEVHSSTGKLFGYVSNPIWLINQSYNWSYKKTLQSASVAGYNFDVTNENIYMINSDSLITYNLRSGDVKAESLEQKCPVDIFMGTSFLDAESQQIYVYETHTGDSGKPTVAKLDLKTKEWNIVNYESLPMHMHHHGVALDRDNKRYFIFGGYGDVYYSKELYSFDYAMDKWRALPLTGDVINPRYFSSMGYRKNNNSLYIYGGMGNESGEQIVGRQYFYDLHQVNLSNNTVTKLWDIPWTKENMVPVREMVIQNDSCFYTLCYPEHFSNSYLKLFRFSFADGEYQILGDSIPIRSEKIKTKANLYYSSKLNSLYAIVQEFDDHDLSSNIKIYSLAFPPVSEKDLNIYNATGDQSLFSEVILVSISLIIIVVLLIIFIYRRRNKKPKTPGVESISNIYRDSMQLEQDVTKPNSIYLFGEFMVRDKSNRDITYMFSSKLKQAFLLILQYSPEGGVSSQRLSELLWPDKSEDKVKNSRGVTINLLRKILKDLDGIQLVFDKGLFKIECDSLCYCDYLRCMEILTSDTIDKYSSELIDIVTRGKFLKSVDLPEFDALKENVEQKLEPVLLLEAENSFSSGAYNSVVVLCGAVFEIDPINDQALQYTIHSLTKLKMDNEAKKQYLSFTIEYKKMIGTEYPLSFAHILERRV